MLEMVNVESNFHKDYILTPEAYLGLSQQLSINSLSFCQRIKKEVNHVSTRFQILYIKILIFVVLKNRCVNDSSISGCNVSITKFDMIDILIVY